ncbi:unnamed protein product [Ceutorhynchus assimilis]|uniref:C3H1-type domain-containing protein n=1 Tax=Ceutorhynchus assimilis TaxID=467358 RepID=A0A9N9MXF8_9CUCU|nr:unnamed protein product [Ceutorhynchus assimilis]
MIASYVCFTLLVIASVRSLSQDTPASKGTRSNQFYIAQLELTGISIRYWPPAQGSTPLIASVRSLRQDTPARKGTRPNQFYSAQLEFTGISIRYWLPAEESTLRISLIRANSTDMDPPTRTCDNYDKNGACPYGITCRDSHNYCKSTLPRLAKQMDMVVSILSSVEDKLSHIAIKTKSKGTRSRSRTRISQDMAKTRSQGNQVGRGRGRAKASTPGSPTQPGVSSVVQRGEKKKKDNRGKPKKHFKISDIQRHIAQSHIKKIPKYRSHYRRQQTDREYLPTDMTIESMYTLYKSEINHNRDHNPKKLYLTDLHLWSDSCGGQNRNVKLCLILKHILNQSPSLQNIYMKFLVLEHSFLPNDYDFVDIEKALKYQQRLYTPRDYINVMKSSRAKNSFIIHKMCKEDFISSEVLEKSIVNRKKDTIEIIVRIKSDIGINSDSIGTLPPNTPVEAEEGISHIPYRRILTSRKRQRNYSLINEEEEELEGTEKVGENSKYTGIHHQQEQESTRIEIPEQRQEQEAIKN